MKQTKVPKWSLTATYNEEKASTNISKNDHEHKVTLNTPIKLSCYVSGMSSLLGMSTKMTQPLMIELEFAQLTTITEIVGSIITTKSVIYLNAYDARKKEKTL